MQRYRWLFVAVLGVLLLAVALTAALAQGNAPTPAATSTPTPSAPSGSGAEGGRQLPPVVMQAIAQLAQDLKVDASQVHYVSMEEIEWPNAALGCPQPDQSYAEVVTPGARVLLEVDGKQYEFHTGALDGTTVVRCDATQ